MSTKAATAAVEAIIGGHFAKGEVKSADDVLVHGKVGGEVASAEAKASGEVVLSPEEATLKGTLKAEALLGQIEGEGVIEITPKRVGSRMLSGGADFYNTLQELAADPNFKKAIIRLPEPDRERRADEELVLRYFAVRYYQGSFSGNVREWLDNFMEDILFKRDGIEFDPDEFRSFFAFIAEEFGDAAFSRSRDGQAFGRLAPAYFEAVVGALAGRFGELRSADPITLQTNLSNAFESDEFQAASGPGAKSKGKMEERIGIVREALLD